MNAHRDPDRLIHDFVFEGAERLHDRVYDAIRAEIEQRPQRVVIGPWRIPEMNRIVTLGLGAAAVVVALLVGAQLVGSPSGGVGFQPSAPAEPTATLAASPSPAASAPPLTEAFASTLHGFSMSYPQGWTARAATDGWTDSTFSLNFQGSHADFLYDPILESDLFLTIASQPIGDSTPEDWVAEQMASDEGCGTANEPIAVDGASGVIGIECNVALVTTAGRGYWIQLYTSGDDPLAVAPYDRAWFQEVLATVQLRPEDAAEPGSSTSP